MVAAFVMKVLSLSCLASSKQNLMFVEPAPCAAPVDIFGIRPALQFGQHLTEDLERRCPDQQVATGPSLDP